MEDKMKLENDGPNESRRFCSKSTEHTKTIQSCEKTVALSPEWGKQNGIYLQK